MLKMDAPVLLTNQLVLSRGNSIHQYSRFVRSADLVTRMPKQKRMNLYANTSGTDLLIY